MNSVTRLPRPPSRPGRPAAPSVDIVVPGLQRAGRARPPRSAACTSTSPTSFPFSWRIVIADNASTDATPAIAAALAADLPGVEVLRLDREGARAGAARGLGGAATPRSSATWTSTSRPTCARCCRSSPRSSPATATSRSARAWRAASRVVRGAKRELISRAYNRLLHAALRARFSDAQCGFKAVRTDARAPAAARACATTAGSSTPSCSCSPSARACASTRCRSTGSTTPTRAWTSCAPRSSDLRGVARLLADGPADALPGRRRRLARSPTRCSTCCCAAPLGAGGRQRAGARAHRGGQHARQPAPHLRHPRARGPAAPARAGRARLRPRRSG